MSRDPGSSSSGRNATADRAIDVLLLFDEKTPVLTAGEVADRLGMSRSTTYRYVQSLRSYNLLDEDEARGGLRLGSRVFELARIARQGIGISEVALPVMRELCDQLDEAVLLTRRSGSMVVCFERAETSHPLRLTYERGRLLPIHAASPSKILFAYADEADVDAAIVPPLERFTETTITDPGELRAELAQIREQGYAISNGELDPGVRGVSAPIFAPDGRITAGLSAGCLTFRTPDHDLETTIAAVRETPPTG